MEELIYVTPLIQKGGVHSEFTIMREAEDSFYLVSAGAFQRLDHDWILKWMPNDGSVQFENLTNSTGNFSCFWSKSSRFNEKKFQKMIFLMRISSG
ncbi:MAG: hypothetical protein CM1200mP5_3880 [Candidatus Pelagibacterales bacterium]|nr:MAG: hypothetical protein CM1200mP5_3880 [Pelagibacterales bacterium]